MECQVEKNEHFRHLLLYEFSRGSQAAEATRNIYTIYGEESNAERTECFARFKQGNWITCERLYNLKALCCTVVYFVQREFKYITCPC
jgi:hypothetical protein